MTYLTPDGLFGFSSFSKRLWLTEGSLNDLFDRDVDFPARYFEDMLSERPCVDLFVNMLPVTVVLT